MDEAIRKIPEKPSEKLLNWLKSCGAYQLFLQLAGRLLSSYFRDYCKIIHTAKHFATAELFYEDEVIEAMPQVALRWNARQQIKERQLKYVNLVRSLPSGADLIQKHLSKIYGDYNCSMKTK